MLSGQDLLNYVPLMQSVELVRAGLPAAGAEPFLKLTEETIGDTARYITYRGTRQVSRITPYGSPGRQVQKIAIGSQDIRLLHSNELLTYSQEMLMILREWDDYKPQHKFFRETLAQQGANFAKRQHNLRLTAHHFTLAYGKLWFNADGEILPNATGADLEVDQGIPAGNKGNIGGMIDASWANPTTNISQHIQRLKVKAVQTTGMPLTHAFYGPGVMQNMIKNTTVQAFLSRNSVLNQKLMDTNELPDGLLGIDKWIPTQEAFYADGADVPRSIYPDDQITFTPTPSKDWYKLFEGSKLIPSKFGVFGTAKEILQSMVNAVGMYRYAKMMDATSFVEEQGDVFLHRITVPEAVYQVDTTP